MKINLIKNSIVFIAIMAVGIIFNVHYFSYPPSYKHAWAQTDQFSLSKGFIRNHFNFFKPETYVLNKQFPDNFEKPYADAITSVDFPLHQYVIAALMKGTSLPESLIFRLFIFLLSVIGLFYLFRLMYLFSESFFKSAIVVLFAATSPVFVYYQANFLPTIPCLCYAITGYYYYFNYSFSHSSKHRIIGISLLTLAALSRTTFLIPFLSVICVECVTCIRNKKIVFSEWIYWIIAMILILLQFIYNRHLYHEHGSMFLNKIMPPDSVSDAFNETWNVIKTWAGQYFTSIHYFVFALLVISYFIIKSHIKIDMRKFLLCLAFLFLGDLLFFIVMLNQFGVHDYYFLDTFYLPAILLFSYLLIHVPIKKFNYSSVLYTIIFLIIFSKVVALNINNQKQIYSESGMIEFMENELKYSDKILDSLQIKRQAKILFMDAQAPNVALAQLDRVGYAVMSTTKEHFERSMRWKYDYIIFLNSSFKEKIYPVFPDIIKKVKKIFDNNHFMVCVPYDNKNQMLESFCKMNDFSEKVSIFNDFENSLDTHWTCNNVSTQISFSGHNSQSILPHQEFGITYADSTFQFLSQGEHSVIISSEVYFDKVIRECNIVVSVDNNENHLYYKASNISGQVLNANKWHHIDIILTMPELPHSNNNLFKVYFWNKGKNNMFVDDLKIRLY